jgi:tripartite-type tricarboxylate transporter receptor subunit TctC
VPTVEEAGYPGFADDTWVGLFAPAGTPPALVARVNAEIAKMLAAPEVRGRIAAAGFEPVGGRADEFARYVKEEVDRWAKIVRATGTKED